MIYKALILFKHKQYFLVLLFLFIQKSFPRFTLSIPWIILKTSIISLNLLCLRENIPNLFNLSLYDKFLKLGIILVALLCTPSNISASFSFIGGQNWIQYSKWGLIYDLNSFDITSADLYDTPLLIIPYIKLALFFANRHCFENLKSLDINTPLSLSSSTGLTHPLFIWYWNSKYLFPKFITPHLFTLKSISHLFAHATNLSEVLYFDLISLRVFTRLAIFNHQQT